MSLGPHQGLVRFGVFEFDPATGDLWKGGRRVKLQNQPRQVLRLLLARPGQLITRDELRRELWPNDTFVDFDNGLNVAIRKIRDALGDVSTAPRFVETERALGYRFIAPIAAKPGESGLLSSASDDPGAEAPAAEPARRESRSLAVAVLALAILAGTGTWFWHRIGSMPPVPVREAADDPITVAVLPLTSVAASDDLLALGIADGIITRLSNLREFRVRPTSAIVPFLGTPTDAQATGRRLRAQFVLAGSIRTTDARVRVTVQLVRTADAASVWGDRYDVTRSDLLAIEDSVAERIAGALRVHVSAAARERQHRRSTRNGAAYERYLMGRARLRSLTELGALGAIAEFEAASRLDPQYALAYAGLATAAAQMRIRFASREAYGVWDTRARNEAGRALALDPELAEAHVALAAIHRFQEYDWDTVIAESRRAIALNPDLDSPHLYLAVAFFHLGLLQEARAEVEAARELNPAGIAEASEILGAIALFDGRTNDAVGHLSHAHDLTESRIVKYLLGWALYYQGDRRRSEELLTSMIDETGPLPGNARATLAAIRASTGAASQARALAARTTADAELIHHGAYGLGTAYAQLGQPEVALRWLAQAAATGFPCYPWYARDPLLDPIRDDPRFNDFLEQLRRSWEAARAKYVSGFVITPS